MLLTTHYLEEAEALCSRIAMLKQGRVIALDRTSELLRSAASNVLRFKTDGAAALGDRAATRASPAASCSCLRTNAHEVEQTLAAIRQAGARGRRRGDAQGRPGRRVHRPDGRRADALEVAR